MTFYLFLPFFWTFSKRLKFLLIGLSFAVFFAAIIGIIDTDWFAYRLLPGTFFIFATGIALAKPDTVFPIFPILVGIATLFIFFIVLTTPQLYATSTGKEVTLGILISVIAVTFLRRFQFSEFDELMGNLSYGVF